MRRLNKYYNEAIVNNNKNKNLSSSDSQLGSISSGENARARWGAPVAHNSQQISSLDQNIPDVGRAFFENKLAEEAKWASHNPQRHVSSIFSQLPIQSKDYREDKIGHFGKFPFSGRHVLLLVDMLIIALIHEGTICLFSF